nr:hypothetical protein [Streptomyces graminilatus]
MTEKLPVRSLAVDTGSKDKIGYVMGYVGPYVQLRPPGGGLEWDADPERVRPATETEQLRARVSELNRAGHR